MKDLIIKYLETTYPNVTLKINEENYIIYMHMCDDLTGEKIKDWFVEKVRVRKTIHRLFSCTSDECETALDTWIYKRLTE